MYAKKELIVPSEHLVENTFQNNLCTIFSFDQGTVTTNNT